MSKSKTMLRVLCVVLSLVMALSVGGVKAQAADEKPSKCVSSNTFDVSNVSIGLTISELKQKVLNDVDPTFSDQGGKETIHTLTVNEAGSIVAYVQQTGGWADFGFFCNRNIEKENTFYYTYEKSDVALVDYINFPVDKGTTIYMGGYWHKKNRQFGYIDFIPASKMIKLDYCAEDENGKNVFYIKNINDSIDHTDVVAFDGAKTAKEVNENLINFEYAGSSTEDGAKVTLGKQGIYTLAVTVYTEDGSQILFSFNVNTKDYLNISSTKIDNPISILANTNVIVGKAAPGATVYVKIGKKEYSGKVDENGFYRIITASLKEGKKVSIWQKVGKKSSKKLSVKVAKGD